MCEPSMTKWVFVWHAESKCEYIGIWHYGASDSDEKDESIIPILEIVARCQGNPGYSMSKG